MLEQAIVAGRDVDLLHIPEARFDDWISQLERGDGWQDDGWPSPLYSSSGLAHGVVLYDPDGAGLALQHRLLPPSLALQTSIRAALAAAMPVYLAEMSTCADRGDRWLHQHLCNQLLKTAYAAWFVAEGHLPPFPKHLSAWYRRFDMDQDVIDLEQRHWAADSLFARHTTLAAMCEAVLRLGTPQPTSAA